MTKFVIFSKIPEEDIFWKSNNVNIIGFFNTNDEAVEFRKEIAHKYLHELTDSGYKLELIDDVYVIMKKITEVSVGYIYNSNIIKNIPIISFHISKCEKKDVQSKIEKNLVVIKSNGSNPEIMSSNQINLIVELTKYLSEGIRLKKISTQ